MWTGPCACVALPSSPPPWRRTVDPEGVIEAVPSRTFAPVSAATVTVAGLASSSLGRRELHQAAVVEHPDAVGEEWGVLECVGDQQGRKPELGEDVARARRAPAGG